MFARLSTESKHLLLAGLVGYALCVWQAFCTFPSWPAPERRTGPDLLDLAGPGLHPAMARQLTRDMLRAAPLASGEILASINFSSIRQPIDFDAVSPDDPDALPRLAELNLRGKSRAVFKPTPTYTMACFMAGAEPGSRPRQAAPPGALAAMFESGGDGAAAVGFTPTAGTSYGTFQIASGTATYSNFIRFLKRSAPDLADRLAGHGPADTGSSEGGVPREWRRIASEHPRRFEKLQYEFILGTHYRPAVAAIYRQTGVDVSALSPASREVLWSTAVQHGAGGAADIYEEAIASLKDRVIKERRLAVFERALIEEVYRLRLTCWRKGAPVGRAAMSRRYGREMAQAISILERHYAVAAAPRS